MIKTARFIFVFCLLSLVFSLLFVNPSFAQSENPLTIIPSPIVQINPQINPNTTPNTNPDVPKNLHNWTQNVMIEVMLALTCQLVGIDPTQPNGQCLGVDQKTGKIGFLPEGNLKKGQIGGAIGGMNNMISMLYTPPIRTGDYFQNLAQNFGIVKNANAAQTGSGFEGLKPLLNLWTAFRNIVYLVFILVFVIIGLAIMLRIKIDPRTTMSIQNRIPIIIVGILLVTFSFAIGGFLVDLMWVTLYLIFGLFSTIPDISAESLHNLSPVTLQGKSPLGIGIGEVSNWTWQMSIASKDAIFALLGMDSGFRSHEVTLGGWSWGDFFSNPGSIAGGIFGRIKDIWFPGFTAGTSVANWIIHIISGVGAFLLAWKTVGWDSPSGGASAFGFGVEVDPGWILNLLPAAAFGTVFFGLIESALRTVIPTLIIYVIINIAILIALVRLWFSLLMAYINILIDVVLAPFWIVGSLVPGSPISAVGWLRDLIANLAAFPAVIAMFLLGRAFVDAFGKASVAGKASFVPPLIGDLGDGAASMLGPIIGIGVILMTPNVVNMVKAALKAPKLDTGPGFARAISAPGGIIASTGHLGSTLYGLSMIPGVNRLPFLNRTHPQGLGARGGGGHAGAPGTGL